MTKQVLQLALEALEAVVAEHIDGLGNKRSMDVAEKKARAAIEALKALAQQGEQKPVAWRTGTLGGDWEYFSNEREAIEAKSRYDNYELANGGEASEPIEPLYAGAAPSSQAK